MKTRTIYYVIFTLCISPGMSGQNFWYELDEEKIRPPDDTRWIVPVKYRTVLLDLAGLRDHLSAASLRFTPTDEQVIFEVPTPNNTYERFVITEAPILSGEDLTRFNRIKTYSGRGIDDPGASVYFDLTPQGFHAMVLRPEGLSYYIDPYYSQRDDRYVVYYKNHLNPVEGNQWNCQCKEPSPKALDRIKIDKGEAQEASKKSQAQVVLKTYTIAIAATGEYTDYHGGTVESGMAAIVTALNRVRGIYETELAISFTLHPNNSDVVYVNPNTDPYSNFNVFAMLTENQDNLDLELGNGTYDVGHVFATGGGGYASVGVICNTSNKAQGVTGLSQPVGDPFYVDYVSHELGHQFGATHTFNGDAGFCGSGRSASSAYEPGSGSTIMAYAGICMAQNLQDNSDPYFHYISIEQIADHVTIGTGASCDVEMPLSNQAPVANANFELIDGKTIPGGTPFELTGQGTDADGHPLTYTWEQWDLGLPGDINPYSAIGPLFRSFQGTSSPTRIFPQLNDILTNISTYGEALPLVDRELNFRLTVRDNINTGGGVDSDLIMLSVDGDSGPFAITSHSTAENISGSTSVTWTVAGTHVAPVNCPSVDILLSTDGGSTFDIPLAENTSNDGSETVNIPVEIHTNYGRIKVKCSNNVFFNVNEMNIPVGNIVDNCASNQVTINDVPIDNGIYISGGTLSSAGTVGNGGYIDFIAKNEVTLNPNFSVNSTGQFMVNMKNCNE